MIKRLTILLFISFLLHGCEDSGPKPDMQLLHTVRQAKKDLLACPYFKREWPEPYITLQKLQRLKVIRDFSTDTGLCGVAQGNSITLYRAALRNSRGCYGSTKIVVAHELLHVVKLPKHKLDDLGFLNKNVEDHVKMQLYLRYIRIDSVEQVITNCFPERTLM